MIDSESRLKILENNQHDLALVESKPRLFLIGGRMQGEHVHAIDLDGIGWIFHW